MAQTRRTTSWAVASLVCSILGDLGAFSWLFITTHPRVETTGVSIGLTMLFTGLPGFALCSLGVIFGVVAVRRILSGGCRGGGIAGTGIVLGWLPFAVFFAGTICGKFRGPW